MNKIRLIWAGILSFSALSCLTACEEGKSFFEDIMVSENGLLDWNKIKDGGAYKIILHDKVNFFSETIWTNDTEYDLSSKFDSGNGLKEFTIEAYKFHTFLGSSSLDKKVSGMIAKCDNKYYLDENIPSFNVTVNNSISAFNIPEKKKYENQLLIEYDTLVSDINTTIGGYTYYDVEGIYYDQSYTKKLEKKIVLSSDLQLYAKITERTKTISFEYSLGRNSGSKTGPIIDKTYKYTDSFNLKDIELPTIEEYTFGYWSGYENYDLDSMPSINAFDADETYKAYYFKDIEIVFISCAYERDFMNPSSKPSSFIEYGSIIAPYKGEITREMFLKYNNNLFDKYYWNTSYNYYYSDKKGFYSECESSKTLPLSYELTTGKTIYVWGEND